MDRYNMVNCMSSNVQLAQPKGLVYSIERFAIYDGPGIRTLVYMKGCPLSCLWCSSPQSQKKIPEILHMELECKKCGRCGEICPVEAITLSQDEGIRIDQDICTMCAACVEACPNHALVLVGKWITVGELLDNVKRDSLFYRRSRGGVTLGGGEPTVQYEFVIEFLKRCKQEYIHTAIETCGYVEWKHFKEILQYVDLVYYDVKNMDPIRHKELTGVSNRLILENAIRASFLKPMIIRIPVVPQYNDSDDNIVATAKFAVELGDNLERIELLPYHKFGIPVYRRIGREYKIKHVEPPNSKHMQHLKRAIESCGVHVQIGG